MRILLAAGVLLSVVANAIAWEADGFKSGDSVERVEQELARLGIAQPARVRHSDRKETYTIGANGQWFTFCRDRLYDYDRLMPFTMTSLAMIVGKEIETRGQPRVNTGPVSIDTHGIWLEWQSGVQVLTLIVSHNPPAAIEATRRFTDIAFRGNCS